MRPAGALVVAALVEKRPPTVASHAFKGRVGNIGVPGPEQQRCQDTGQAAVPVLKKMNRRKHRRENRNHWKRVQCLLLKDVSCPRDEARYFLGRLKRRDLLEYQVEAFPVRTQCLDLIFECFVSVPVALTLACVL